MTDQQSTYRQIFKATSVFGGVQVFNILINILKSKVIAVLLGPTGIGLFGLLNSTLDVIKTITGLGLSSSAVKEVSEAAVSGDIVKISRILKTLQNCLYITGSFGFIITLILAPYLSKWTFGNEDYTWSFMGLSIVVFLSALSSGQLAVLQGIRKIGYMAKSGMIGSFFGLLLSVPLFYFFSFKGVVPSIIISALCVLVLSSIYARKISTVKIHVSLRESLNQGHGMIKLGIALMFSNILIVLASYLLRAYIAQNGGMDEVGLFQSGFSISEVYFGLIFTAMASDYYPRLVGVSADNDKISSEVNKQAEIGILIASPIIVIALFLIPTAIQLLYSDVFLGAVGYVKWAMLGNIFKIGSWTMGYVLIAKGQSKIYVYTEFISSLCFLFLGMIGYNLWGIEGLGISFLIYYLFHFIGISILCKRLFELSYQRDFWELLFAVLVLAILAFCIQLIESLWMRYCFSAILLILNLYLSYYQLNKRICIFSFILKKINRK